MKKITFKTLSILLAAVLLVVALHLSAFAEEVSATSLCQHIFDETESVVSYRYESDSVCIRIVEVVEICQKCGLENTYVVENKTSHHDEEFYNTYYSSHSNEYHMTTVYLEEICLCCGGIINSYEEYFELECHEFDDSVDPEVDLEGVCILCGDEVSW